MTFKHILNIWVVTCDDLKPQIILVQLYSQKNFLVRWLELFLYANSLNFYFALVLCSSYPVLALSHTVTWEYGLSNLSVSAAVPKLCPWLSGCTSKQNDLYIPDITAPSNINWCSLQVIAVLVYIWATWSHIYLSNVVWWTVSLPMAGGMELDDL